MPVEVTIPAPADSVTSDGATVFGQVSDATNVVGVGFYVSATNPTPGPGDTVVEAELFGDLWFAALTGLPSGATIYYRAWAQDSIEGNVASDVDTFTTLGVPRLTTVRPVVAGPTTAISGGAFLSGGGSAITSRFVVVRAGLTPTVDNYDLIVNAPAGDGSPADWDADIEGLTLGVMYCLAAGATNSTGTGYGRVWRIRAGVGVVTADHSDVGLGLGLGVG